MGAAPGGKLSIPEGSLQVTRVALLLSCPSPASSRAGEARQGGGEAPESHTLLRSFFLMSSPSAPATLFGLRPYHVGLMSADSHPRGPARGPHKASVVPKSRSLSWNPAAPTPDSHCR